MFDDLAEIANDVMSFKNALRTEVDRWGGITKLAETTGIPQPSLSRFFSSASMPRRTTLFRIAEALQLRESAILSKWAAYNISQPGLSAFLLFSIPIGL